MAKSLGLQAPCVDIALSVVPGAKGQLFGVKFSLSRRCDNPMARRCAIERASAPRVCALSVRWCVCAPWGCSAGARKTMRRERSIWLLREQQTRPCAHLAQKNQAQGPSPPSQDRYLGRSRWEKVPTGSLWPKTVKADFPSTLARVATFRKSQATFGGYFSHFFEKSRFRQKRDVSNTHSSPAAAWLPY